MTMDSNNSFKINHHWWLKAFVPSTVQTKRDWELQRCGSTNIHPWSLRCTQDLSAFTALKISLHDSMGSWFGYHTLCCAVKARKFSGGASSSHTSYHVGCGYWWGFRHVGRVASGNPKANREATESWFTASFGAGFMSSMSSRKIQLSSHEFSLLMSPIWPMKKDIPK